MYISLGKDCSIAYHLQKLGYRKISLPFDWLLSKNIHSVLEEEFVDLFNPKYLKFGGYSNFCKIEEDFNEELIKMMRVTNTKYGIHFLHDFKDFNDLPAIKQKYERRIQRFLSLMRNTTIHKKLFRIGNAEGLEQLFIKLNFQNYNLYHLPDFSSNSWKREDFDWKEWFEI